MTCPDLEQIDSIKDALVEELNGCHCPEDWLADGDHTAQCAIGIVDQVMDAIFDLGWSIQR